MTGRECGRVMRELAGLPQAAAEVPGGISVARVFKVQFPQEVWGLNPKLGVPAYSTRAGKGTQIISSCEKQQDFARERQLEIESLLKSQRTKFL